MKIFGILDMLKFIFCHFLGSQTDHCVPIRRFLSASGRSLGLIGIEEHCFVPCLHARACVSIINICDFWGF